MAGPPEKRELITSPPLETASHVDIQNTPESNPGVVPPVPTTNGPHAAAAPECGAERSTEAPANPYAD